MLTTQHARPRKVTFGEAVQQAVAFHQQGRFAEAERLYDLILSKQADHFDGLHLLGLLRYQQRRLPEALELIAAALRVNAESIDALTHYGVVLDALGRPYEALGSYERALALSPDNADVLINLGNALCNTARYESAIQIYERALAIRPGEANALSNRANVLAAMGRTEEALAGYRSALEVMPGHKEALFYSAKLLQRVGRHAEAVKNCNILLALEPGHLLALNVKGTALLALNRPQEALACHDKVLATDPKHVDALTNRSRALAALKKFDEALTSANDALAIDPNHVDALNTRGVLLQWIWDPDEAISRFDQALAQVPGNPDILYNKAAALVDLGRHEDALAVYREVLAAAPDHANAHFHQALVQLALGNFREGWRNYELRWESWQGATHLRNFSEPLWLGKEPIDGKTILLHAEQGLGDTIQFSRYVRLVADRNARMILEVQPQLKMLMASFAGSCDVIARGEPLPKFDFHCPLMSLPLAFETQLATIPPLMDLIVPPDRLAKWQSRIGTIDVPRVGLVWAGGERKRAIPLDRLSPIMSIPGIQFVSLQFDLRDGDATVLASHPQVMQLGPELKEFADLAAVISQLDLVITVDTVTAHIAGTLRKPVWILLSTGPDFRWMLQREDSPWYPSARLFRQSRQGDWGSAVERVRAGLAGMSQTSESAPPQPELRVAHRWAVGE